MISKKIIDTIAVQLLISKRINKLVSDLVAKGKLKMKKQSPNTYEGHNYRINVSTYAKPVVDMEKLLANKSDARKYIKYVETTRVTPYGDVVLSIESEKAIKKLVA